MSQSGFEMFSNVAGMVIVIADVIFFYALWNIFCKNKKRKNVHDDRECVTALKYWIGIYIKFADKWAADNIGYCHFDLQYCPI